MTDKRDFLDVDTARLGARPDTSTYSAAAIPPAPTNVDPALLVETISAMYETIAAPDVWARALDAVNALVGAKHAMAGVFDVQCPAVHRHSASSGLSASGLRKILTLGAVERFERFEMLYRLPPQTLMHYPSSDQPDQRIEDGFAQELGEKYGIYRTTTANANPHASWFDYVTLFFEDDTVGGTPVANDALSYLLPHMAKANATRRPLEILKQKYNAVFQALDWLAFGVLLIAPDRSCPRREPRRSGHAGGSGRYSSNVGPKTRRRRPRCRPRVSCQSSGGYSLRPKTIYHRLPNLIPASAVRRDSLHHRDRPLHRYPSW